MESFETIHDTIRGVSITRKDERSFSLLVSLDIHEAGEDARTQALYSVYVKMLLAGTQKKTRMEFLDAVSMLGASISFSVGGGYLSFTVSSLDTHAQKAFSLLQEALEVPAFDAKELVRIKELVQNELHEEKEDAKARVVDIFTNRLYGKEDRRYCASPDEEKSHVASIKRAELIALHKKVLRNAWIFTLVANNELEVAIRKKLLALRSSYGPLQESVSVHTPRAIEKREILLEKIPSKQNIEFAIGAPVPLLPTDKEFFALNFGMRVLGKWGGFAGRLMSTVREKEGLTYGIYAKTEGMTATETGHWRIMTFFAPEKAVEGITSTLREIKKISEDGITDKEYTRFIEITKTGEALLRDSITRTAGDIHNYLVRGFLLHDIEEYKKNLTSVSKKEVNEALKKYLHVDRLLVAAAGPVHKAPSLTHTVMPVAKSSK